jgi:hypothetical protein
MGIAADLPGGAEGEARVHRVPSTGAAGQDGRLSRPKAPPGYKTQSPDTDYATEVEWFDLLRKLSPSERARLIDEQVQLDDHLALVGTRLRWPDAGEEEVRLRAAALRLGPDVVAKHFGWAPEDTE